MSALGICGGKPGIDHQQNKMDKSTVAGGFVRGSISLKILNKVREVLTFLLKVDLHQQVDTPEMQNTMLQCVLVY